MLGKKKVLIINAILFNNTNRNAGAIHEHMERNLF
jgi:hypothetical protein